MSFRAMALEQFYTRCRMYGLAVTKQRTQVYKILLYSTEHPTADRVYEQAREEFPGMSRMSVYRILETLASCHMIRKVNHPGAATRYDAFVKPHHHLICVKCGLVVDIDPVDKDFSLELKQIPEGFRVLDYCVDFQGLCAACVNSGKTLPQEAGVCKGEQDGPRSPYYGAE
ncbi:MAG: transcriptional repressor [Planctomycetia bacterium]|nr:transcriptional repressor [Planctomycetia bacterium]